MIDWYKKVVFENYTNFSGRARRSEYWYFILCNYLIVLALYLLLFFSILLTGNSEEGSIGTLGGLIYGIITLYSLATAIPSLAVLVRRIHDIGKSGWSLLIGFIPIVGTLIVLVWLFTDSQQGNNKWGANPKEDGDSIDEIGSIEIN